MNNITIGMASVILNIPAPIILGKFLSCLSSFLKNNTDFLITKSRFFAGSNIIIGIRKHVTIPKAIFKKILKIHPNIDESELLSSKLLVIFSIKPKVPLIIVHIIIVNIFCKVSFSPWPNERG